MRNSDYFTQRDESSLNRLEHVIADLPDFAEDYFLSIQMRTSSLTRLNYAGDLRIFFEFLSDRKFKKPVKDISIADMDYITSKDIERFLAHLSSYRRNGKTYRCNENAKERKLCSVRAFLKYLFKEDLVNANIADKVDSIKLHEKPILFLDNDEVNELLDLTETGVGLSGHQKTWHDRTKKRDFAMISLFLGTGMRISELVGIDKTDLDFSNNAVRITRKGGNKSIVYFPQEVADSLIEYLTWIEEYATENNEFSQKIQGENALFLSMQGKRITVRAVQNLVKKYAGIVTPLKKITPHKLRSTFGTGLYRDTRDIYIVADILGHKDINTTKKHYAATSDDMRRDVAKTLKLRKNDDSD